MSDDRQKQIEILATKIMGWKRVEVFLKAAPVNQWEVEGKRVAGYDWNPFTDPADGKMLEDRLIELGYFPDYRLEDEGWFAALWKWAEDEPCKLDMHVTARECQSLEIARCEAALQLPECEE